MANEDYQKQVGTAKLFKDDRGGANLYNNPIIGIVKNNIDPLRTGKIQVYLVRMNGSNEDDPNNWTWVSYMSPFFGYTPNTGSPDSDGSYVGNKNSYGFWATPPDIGTQVMCIFINGLPELGYYIGGIPNPSLTHMVPAIGASENVIPNAGEAKSYGGATRLPVSEYNDANDTQDNSTTPHDAPRPIHSYQAAILNKQGLLRDPDRGAISSSSQRESPSRVFGMSTPGRPIYAGGYNDSTISQAIANDSIPDKNFQVIGRIGGHTLVMDDGDLVGRDQLVRLRTAQGHMILMNDYAQTLFIIHANGQSYIELGKEGTIDMFSTNSVNIRTQGDLNLHADRNININATKELNISAENINMESTQNTNQYTGSAYKHFTKGDHALKVDGKMSFYSKGDSSIRSDANAFVNGKKVNLNTGTSSLVPEPIKQLPIVAHTDTLYDEEKGWAPAPSKLPSIVSRAPAHSPWTNANQGVDVKVNSSAAANFPSNPTPAVKSLNETLPPAQNPTNATLISTVPSTSAVNNNISSTTSAGLVSQMAVNAATGPSSNAVASLAGVVNTGPQSYASIGTVGLNPTQLANAGILKPGSDVAVNAAIAKGKSIPEAMPTNVFTGKDGITNVQNLVNSTQTQTNIATNLLKKSENELKTVGVITGTESSSEIGGLLVSGATAGVSATLTGCGLSNVPLDPGQFSNPAAKVNDVKALVAGGNAAGKITDKIGNALSGISVTDTLKGLAQGAFKAITGTWKALTANKPQNLAAIAAQNSAQTLGTSSAVAAGALSSLGSAATSVANTGNIANLVASTSSASLTQTQAGDVVNALAGGTGGSTGSAPLPGMNAISGIPGGTSSITSYVAQNISTLPPGTTGISNTIKEVTGSVVNGSQGVNSALGAVPTQIIEKGGITNLVSNNLGPSDGASLMAAIQSAGSSGALSIKTPTVGLDTFDTAGLEAQSKNLLGDPKIPPLNFDQIKVAERSPSQLAQLDATRTELSTLQEDAFDLRVDLADAKINFKNGRGSQQEIATIEAAYKANLQKQEELKKKLASLSSIQIA